MSPRPSTRIQGLDVLRGLAIILVLGRHGAIAPANQPILHAITSIWATGGWVGVDLFFVLSGFLVSGLIFRECQENGDFSLKRFFLRRGLRIYPPFYAFLLARGMLALVFRSDNAELFTFSRFLREAFFVQNYFPGIFAHTWSLAVEEHFYILLPLVLLAFLKFNPGTQNPFKGLPRLFLVIAAFCLLERIILAWQLPYSFETHHVPTHLRIDSLFFGVLISYFHHFQRERFDTFVFPRRFVFTILGIVFLVPAFIFVCEKTPWVYSLGFSLFCAGSGMILMGALYLSAPIRNSLLFKLAGAIGSYSYSIYLIHFMAQNIVQRKIEPFFVKSFGWNWGLYFLFYYVGAILAGIGFSLLVEAPVLRLRERLFPSRAASNSPGPASKIGNIFPEKPLEARASDGVL
jgi:peptidoglycan/LPS O-acetylase OafA/YrhL